MTALLNIFFAVLLFGTGAYHMWNGNWTDGLTMLVLITILHNAAGGYKAAMNTVEIYRLLAEVKGDIQRVKKSIRWLSDSREVK